MKIRLHWISRMKASCGLLLLSWQADVGRQFRTAGRSLRSSADYECPRPAATHALNSNPLTRRIAVMALTANAMPGDEAKARTAGCDGYLTKPLNTPPVGVASRVLIRHLSKFITPCKHYDNP